MISLILSWYSSGTLDFPSTKKKHRKFVKSSWRSGSLMIRTQDLGLTPKLIWLERLIQIPFAFRGNLYRNIWIWNKLNNVTWIIYSKRNNLSETSLYLHLEIWNYHWEQETSNPNTSLIWSCPALLPAHPPILSTVLLIYNICMYYCIYIQTYIHMYYTIWYIFPNPTTNGLVLSIL